MRKTELKVLSELMKNSKISDRELAKIVGVSQPTVTRTRGRLERNGYIREYTLIPDFAKLGFELMALIFIRYRKEITPEEYEKVKVEAKKVEKETPRAFLMAVTGIGLGYDRALLTFHENYSSYSETVKKLRQLPFMAVADIESFLIPLGEQHYQPLTFSALAEYVAQQEKKE